MPTERQKLAAERILENSGKLNPKSTGEILLEVGYSPGMAKNPLHITKSKGFIQILEEAGVTDDRLSRVLEEGLNATRTVIVRDKAATKEESEASAFADEVPDYAIRHKYLETAIKVKGHITPMDVSGGNTYNTFVQQNNLNPNTPEAKTLVDDTLDMLMKQTSRNG